MYVYAEEMCFTQVLEVCRTNYCPIFVAMTLFEKELIFSSKDSYHSQIPFKHHIKQ